MWGEGWLALCLVCMFVSVGCELADQGPHVQSLLTHKKAAYATSHANVRMYKD